MNINMGLIRFQDYIKLFRTYSPTMPAQIMEIFVAVVLEPNISMPSLAAKIGTSQASISRNCTNILEKRYGLVETYENPENRRTKLVRLSPKGHKMADTLRRLT